MTTSCCFYASMGFNMGFRDCSGSWTLRVHLDGSRIATRMNWRESARRQGLELALLIGCEIARETLPQQLPQGLMRSSRNLRRWLGRYGMLFRDSLRKGLRRVPILRLGCGVSICGQKVTSPKMEAPFKLLCANGRRLYVGQAAIGFTARLAPFLRPLRLLRKYGPAGCGGPCFLRERSSRYLAHADVSGGLASAWQAARSSG